MNTLPVEILCNVFIHVSLPTKLKCRTVCRQWATIIQEQCLLHTITITKERTFENVVKLIQSQPWLGKQVNNLIFRDFNPDRFNETIHLHQFPNLKLFFTRFSISSAFTMRDPLSLLPEKLQPFLDHAQYIVDKSGPEITQSLLRLGVYRSLTSLEVVQDINLHMNKTISLLTNTPALTRLVLRYFFFSMDDVEQIHANLSLLRVFKLEGGKLEIPNKLPNFLQPANSVTSIMFDSINADVDQQIKILHYIRKKYINLTSFRFLTSYHQYFDQPEVIKFHNEGLAPLLQSLGPQLLTFQLSQYELTALFQDMDKFGCRIQNFILDGLVDKLPVTNSLMKSNQRNYIQKFRLGYIETNNLDWVYTLSHLTKLDLIFRKLGTIIYLDEILSSCSDTLNTLRIEETALAIKNTSTTKQFPSLKKLIFRGSPVRLTCYTFLSNSCPNLTSLTLHKRSFSAGSTLLLPNIRLSYLDILLSNRDKKSYWHVVTKDQGVFYQVNRMDFYVHSLDSKQDYDQFLYDTFNTIPYEEIPANEVITKIQCASIQKLVLNCRVLC